MSLCGYGIRTLRSCEPERDILCKSWDLHKALIVNNLRICHDLLFPPTIGEETNHQEGTDGIFTNHAATRG